MIDHVIIAQSIRRVLALLLAVIVILSYSMSQA
jgi:hypothetical protein